MGFDANHPKHHYCHVTLLARVLIVIGIVSNIYVFTYGGLVNCIGLPIMCIGAYGVFREARTPLLVFIAGGIASSVLWKINNIKSFLDVFANGELVFFDDDDHKLRAMSVTILFFICTAAFQCFAYIAYWKLSKMIKSRATSENSLLDNLCDEKKFDYYDPTNYCCSVITLARVIMVIGLIGNGFCLYNEIFDVMGMIYFIFDIRLIFPPRGTIGILMICLGIYGVFMEARTPLLIFISASIASSVLTMINILSLAFDPVLLAKYEDLVLPIVFCICIVFAIYQSIAYLVYWKLAKFIKDREISQQIPELTHFSVEKTSLAAAAATEAPPSYEKIFCVEPNTKPATIL